MFIKKWQLIFLYIGRTDWGTGHLTVIVGTGAGHLPTKIVQWAGHLTNFFKCTGFTRWFSRRMLAARMDSYIKTSKKRSNSIVFPMKKNLLVQLLSGICRFFVTSLYNKRIPIVYNRTQQRRCPVSSINR